MPDRLLEGNKHFLEGEFAPHHLEQFRTAQHPHTCWIGCSDSRVPPEIVSGTGVGELFVHRNVANMVPPDDPAVGAVLEYAVMHLRVKRIVLCGHYGCGGIKALWEGAPQDTLVAAWLRHGGEALRDVRNSNKTEAGIEEQALHYLVEQNLRVQRGHLLQYPFVRDAMQGGHLHVRMFIYDVATGKLKELKH